jgi:cathepsin B
MKTYILLALFALSISTETRSFITPEHVEKIRSSASFQVSTYEDHPFKDFTLEQIRCKLGLQLSNKKNTIIYGEADDTLPENFDSRETFKGLIHPILDQQHCGSCWAFAASEVLSDRFAIATQGKINVVLSPQDLTSCDPNNFGCQGGYINKSWDYLTETGIVTDECLPYTSGKDGDSGSCPFNKKNKCVGKGDFKKYKAESYKNFQTIQEIKREIVEHGPVEAGFTVYEDFISYTSGIYENNSDVVLGGHAVKIIGYGVEKKRGKDTEYWIVANSWSEKWGEKGHFRIKIGEIDFESEIYAGTPKIEKNGLFIE